MFPFESLRSAGASSFASPNRTAQRARMSKRPAETAAEDFLVSGLPEDHGVLSPNPQQPPSGAQTNPQQESPNQAQMPTTTTTTPGSANKKARTWERHRWSFEHDDALFDEVSPTCPIRFAILLFVIFLPGHWFRGFSLPKGAGSLMTRKPSQRDDVKNGGYVNSVVHRA